MKLGRNERCWCGSGKKFKRCHLGRDAGEPLTPQAFLGSLKKTYGKGYCLHPEASSETCRGKIVKAHTIQRNGGLSAIASKGHVYNCLMHERSLSRPLHPENNPNRVGIGQASTFTGFCSYHDDLLFAPIEKNPFAGSAQQVALLGYRAISRELFMKNADMALSPVKREMDRGLPARSQQAVQTYVSLHQSGVAKAIEELERLKCHHDEMLLNGDFRSIGYFIIIFEDTPDFLCSAIHQTTHDFRGNRVHVLGHLDSPAYWLHFSLIPTDEGGAAIFSWLREDKICEEFVNTLDELPDEELPHAIVRFTFEFFENTYFAPEWWEKLDKSVQVNLMERQIREIPPTFDFPRPDDCLRDDGIRAVDWKVGSRLKHVVD